MYGGCRVTDGGWRRLCSGGRDVHGVPVFLHWVPHSPPPPPPPPPTTQHSPSHGRAQTCRLFIRRKLHRVVLLELHLLLQQRQREHPDAGHLREAPQMSDVVPSGRPPSGVGDLVEVEMGQTSGGGGSAGVGPGRHSSLQPPGAGMH